MEQAQQHLMMADDQQGGKVNSSTRSQANNSSNNNNGSGTSSTRWTPTTDQIRILKDLYYNNGVRSPNADQIQRISARLRQYGKIEGKNVFYWFQNHKARERQKKRFNATNNNNNNIVNNTGLVPVTPVSPWKLSDSSTPYVHSAATASKYPNNSQHLFYPNGHNQMTGFGYGSITMEKSFGDCSISAGESSMGHNFGWAAGGLDHHLPQYHPYTCASASPYTINDTRKSIISCEYHELLASSPDHEYEDKNRGADIETLPLFPMRGEDANYSFYHINSSETDGWFHRDIGGPRASLELSLSSYGRIDRI